MTELLHTEWRWYGESSLPWWAMLPLAVAACWLMLRWLRAERRRRNVAARMLPLTAVLLVALTTVLAVQPTWVRIDTWAYPAEQIAVLDESASMDRPLAGNNLTAQLDALAFVTPQAVAGRVLTPRRLADALAADLRRAGELRRALRRGLDDLQQLLPVGTLARTALDDATRWLAETRESRIPLSEALQQDMANNAAVSPDAVKPVAEALPALMDALATPPAMTDAPDGAPGDAEAMKAVLLHLESMTDILRDILPALHALQADGDRVFADAGGDDLARQVEAASAVTRLDAARQLLAGMRTPMRRVSTAPRRVDRDTTDLHRTLAGILDAREGRAINDIVLLSDGGQNTPPTPSVPRRLANAGIRLTTVGVGMADAEPDSGIVDWHAPAILTRNTEAQVRVRLKTIPGDSAPVGLELHSGETLAASLTVVPDEVASRWIPIPFTLAEPGRHRMRLAVTEPTPNPDNTAVEFAVAVRQRPPRILLVGHEPNWDTTYWLQAGRAAGFSMDQRYTGVGDDPPARGGGRNDIPRTPEQWSRYDAVILHGDPFDGFDEDDARALFETVAANGRTLLLLADGATPTYIGLLAERFGWHGTDASARPAGRFRPADAARHLPLLRVGPDGAVSARWIAAFGEAASLHRVPPQHVPLLVAADDTDAAVMSLGFHGRGKVILWGISGLQELAEFGQADVLKRLLEQLVADAVVPPAVSDDADVAVYPYPPVRGRENYLVALNPAGPDPTVDGAALPAETGFGNRTAAWIPETTSEAQLAAGGEPFAVTPVDNPGMEQIFHEFDDRFMMELARAAEGRHVGLHEARAVLEALPPASWQGQTAQRYAPADHWGLIAGLALLGAAHWVLRKLSGLAM